MKYTFINAQNRALNDFYLKVEEFEDFDLKRLYRLRAKTIETFGQFLYDIYISADEGTEFNKNRYFKISTCSNFS